LIALTCGELLAHPVSRAVLPLAAVWPQQAQLPCSLYFLVPWSTSPWPPPLSFAPQLFFRLLGRFLGGAILFLSRSRGIHHEIESKQGESGERASRFHLSPHLHDSLFQLRVVLGVNSPRCSEAVNTISRVGSDRGLHQSVVTARDDHCGGYAGAAHNSVSARLRSLYLATLNRRLLGAVVSRISNWIC
jgi:hypothetical protein